MAAIASRERKKPSLLADLQPIMWIESCENDMDESGALVVSKYSFNRNYIRLQATEIRFSACPEPVNICITKAQV